MKKTMTMLTITALAATMATASTVKYDMDTTADFTRYQKVAFADAPAKGAEAMADKRIREALATELEAKGYTMTDAKEADLLLDYVAVVRQRRQIDETGGPRFGRNLRLRSHPEGTLVVSFATREGETVWHGAVTDALASNPEKAEKKTEKAIAKLLEKLPQRSPR
jgi:hypothetical protein